MSAKLEETVFGHRRAVVAVFAILTIVLGAAASRLRVDTGFSKFLPLEHEYMRTFAEYHEEFGGADRILVALTVEEGDIFTRELFEILEVVTDEVFFIPGVDRARVYSLFTPNVRFTEVVEDGFAGDNVVPAGFTPTPENLERVRANVLKSDVVGRLVANDFTGAIVAARLLEHDPTTGERLDYLAVAEHLERDVREKHAERCAAAGIGIHIIGFAKVMGEIAAGAGRVVLFFGVTLLVTAVLLYAFCRSVALTFIALSCSLVAVVWQLGLLVLLGYGMDPMSILVPFLVFAIAVSHGVQMINAAANELLVGANGVGAARAAFRRLIVPGCIALASDCIGFLAILLIGVRVIREIAVAAGLGVAVIILTNLVLLPVALSFVTYRETYRGKLGARRRRLAGVWRGLARVTERKPAAVIVAACVALAILAGWKATDVPIGDLHRGVPELRADSRYNRDSEIIGERFSIGVDVLSVITEAEPEACMDPGVMTAIDEFAWRMRNVEGVRSVASLAGATRIIHAGLNEGSLAWRVIPRNPSVLGEAASYVPTSSGLVNTDCSVMPVLVYTADHRAETVARVVTAAERYSDGNPSDRVRFRLAAGNIGVMAAANEVVAASQFPMVALVFGAVIVLCLIAFRSAGATACVVLPLILVSLLAYALMSLLEIGLKVTTLPVVALGVGIGVDYGIYVFSRLRVERAAGRPLREAYAETLDRTGVGVLLTAATLAAGVATWIFSPLRFQTDMGVLLTFVLLVNMLGAVVLLPALARWLTPEMSEKG